MLNQNRKIHDEEKEERRRILEKKKEEEKVEIAYSGNQVALEKDQGQAQAGDLVCFYRAAGRDDFGRAAAQTQKRQKGTKGGVGTQAGVKHQAQGRLQRHHQPKKRQHHGRP